MSVIKYRLRKIEERINKRHNKSIVVATESKGCIFVDGKKWNKPTDWDEDKDLLIKITREQYAGKV